jgi:hypothetical protein
MSNVARLRIDAKAAGQDIHLGPAEVKRVSPHELEVRLLQGENVLARLALGYAYEAQPGDQVLVIGNADGFWVIGVVHTTGRAVISFPGDAEVRAGGVLTLAGDNGVAVTGPQVEVQAGKLRAIASEVVSSFQSLRQRVSELFSMHAGQTHTVVEGSSHTQAKSATILTEGKVAINGKEVHLG